MNKIAVIYASVHHGNTKKLVEEVAKEVPMDVLSVEEAKKKDLSSYEFVGIASGIYFGKMHQAMLEYLESNPDISKETFAMITCGDGGKKHIGDTETVLLQYGLHAKGVFVCKGFDTYGPFKLIGGINKHHPNDKDVKNAIDFMHVLLLNVEK